MKFRVLLTAAVSILAGTASTAAFAADDDPSFIAVGAGYYDINDNEEAAEFRVEWRGRRALWIFKPQVGVMGTSDGAVYGYAGILLDLYFGRRIVFTPSFAAGAYHDGDGKDLGQTVEFRSAAELSYRFDDRSRLGVMFYHISNAHLGDSNPGTEVLSLTYAFPLN